MTSSGSSASYGEIPDWAYGVRKLVVFSGAGVSTDSGIPDFRGPRGVWTRNPGLRTQYTYQAFMADPVLRAGYWRSRLEHPVWRAEPNAAHRAVASLAGSEIDTTVVTQNTDGLHQLSGTPDGRVIELHGTMRTSECVRCGRRTPTADILARIEGGEATPACRDCGGVQKTASTMFGLTMDPDVFDRAAQAVGSCDLILAVGTTLTVEPAGSLCATGVKSGARLVVVNFDPTPYDAIATDLVRDPLGQSLPRIVAQLRAAAQDDGARESIRLADPHAHLDHASGDPSIGRELVELCRSADEAGLGLGPQVVASAAATAILCGAQDEEAALAVLGHIRELEDPDLRLRVARWLRGKYGSDAVPTGTAAYWSEGLPDTEAENLVAFLATPRFLLNALMESTAGQDRRALYVLARAANTRDDVRARLGELLTVLPGLSPVAVDVVLNHANALSLTGALTSLAEKNRALPADLLDTVPSGVTVFGEFPILVAESLVEAYEGRAQTQNVLRGLTKALIQLAERLADAGRIEQAATVARRVVETAARLDDESAAEWRSRVDRLVLRLG